MTETDDAAFITAIAQGVARSMGEIILTTPDLIEGLLGGRYRLLVGGGTVALIGDPDWSPHTALAAHQ